MKKIIVLLIICFGVFLRLYRLDIVPPSASLDEASIGWNAYSILKTGKDEYGTAFPLLLRAYDDWRPALYVYTVIPFIKIFGLNVLSIRLPSVLFSVTIIWAAYFISVKLEKLLRIPNISLIAAFLTAISPWHIYLSRLGHEANLGLFFFVWGLYFIFAWIETQKPKQMYSAACLLMLSMYSYQSEKLVVPIIGLAFCILFWKKLRKPEILKLVFGVVVLLVPLVMMTFSGSGLIRLAGTSAFNRNEPMYETARRDHIAAIQSGNIFSRIFTSESFTDARVFTGNYFSHFEPFWLFTGGPYESHKVPGLGLLYVWEAPFLLYGIYLVLRNTNRVVKLFIIIILLAIPLPAAITTQAPHAMRTYGFIPFLQIITAFGIADIMNKRSLRIITPVFVSAFVFIGLSSLYEKYFTIFPKTQSGSFQYALGQTMKYIVSDQKQYNQIVFDNADGFYQSYMFFLFYTKYDPVKYQKYGGTGSGGYAQTHEFDKFQFRPIDWENWYADPSILFVGNISKIGTGANILKTFSNLDGSGIAAIAEKKY